MTLSTDPAQERRVLFFDLETQKSAAEVGGWNNIHLMGLAVGVIYDSLEKKYIHYWESDVDALIEKLRSADLVVGFNHIRFDYRVLSAYTGINLPQGLKSFDILLDVQQRLGHRLSLGHLASATLGKGKTADGLQSLQWWKEGKKDLVSEYCESDVEVTKSVFEYGLENHNLVYKAKNGDALKLALDWDLEKIILDAARETSHQ